MQIVDGEARAVAIKEGKGSGGILARDAKIIRALLPIRDAVREVLRAQAADQPWARGAGPAAHRLQQFRPRLRADQPHRRLGHDRSGDRRGTGDPSPAEPRAVRRRSRLLAGRQHRGLRPRKRPRPHGADLPRAGDRPAVSAADRDRRRRARRHPQRDRPRGHRPPGRTARPRSRDRPRPARRNGVPQSRPPKPGRPTTPISRVPSAPSWRSPRRRPSAIRSMRATSPRCGACSPRTCVRRTSPRVSARRGFPPPTSRPSPPR